MFHVAIWQVLVHLAVGARVVVRARADVADILATIERERCTNMNAVPTLYNWIVSHPELDRYDLSSMRLMSYGGSPFPEEVLRRCIRRFGPIFAQGYGLTEAGPGRELPRGRGSCARRAALQAAAQRRPRDAAVRSAHRRRRRMRGGAGPAGRSAGARREHHAGLLEEPGADCRAPERRMAAHGRPRRDGRRGLHLPARPQGRHDRHGRRERLSHRSRGRAVPAPGRAGAHRRLQRPTRNGASACKPPLCGAKARW